MFWKVQITMRLSLRNRNNFCNYFSIRWRHMTEGMMAPDKCVTWSEVEELFFVDPFVSCNKNSFINTTLQTFWEMYLRHCQRHNGPRLLSLTLELSLKQNRIQVPVWAFSTTWCSPPGEVLPTLCTSMSSYSALVTSSHIISKSIRISPIVRITSVKSSLGIFPAMSAT